MWVKMVYIDPQGIASDRNPLVTCPGFDHISFIFGKHHDIMQCITSHFMGTVRAKIVYLKIPSISECTYTTLLTTVHCANFNYISPICQ